MKLLLTSGGVTNPTIRAALVGMLGKPIEDSHALAIPTGTYGHPWCTPSSAYRFLTGSPHGGMCDLGWASIGVLELTALPSIGVERWEPWVRQTDALLVDGGDAIYLRYWLQRSGLADLLPSLDSVWVGLSAGSMVLTPRVGEDFTSWGQPQEGDSGLGVVDFSIYPHLDHPDLPSNTLAAARNWVVGIDGPAFAIDDQTAIAVHDGVATVVSEGTWVALTT